MTCKIEEYLRFCTAPLYKWCRSPGVLSIQVCVQMIEVDLSDSSEACKSSCSHCSPVKNVADSQMSSITLLPKYHSE